MSTKKCNLLFLITLLFFSCNQQEEQVNPKTTPSPVQFQSTISGASYTRVSGNQWDNDYIGVYMFEAGKELNDNSILASNKAYVTQGNGNFIASTPDDMIFFPDDGSAVNFIAYYPYDASLAGYTYAVDISDQFSQEAIDLLYARPSTEHTNSNLDVPFSFSHQLVKLLLNLSPSTENESLEGVTVKIEGMKTKASFDLANGNLVIDETSEQEIILKTTWYTTGKAQAEAILLPASQLAEVKVIFTLPSGDNSTWEFTNEMSFKEGNRYTYDVILKGEQTDPTPNYGWFETPVITSMENTVYVEHFLPESDKGHIRNYSLLYDTKEKLAYWVAYPMHSSYVGSASRTDAWQYDPKLQEIWQPNLISSYPDRTLDRGHQLASADRTYSSAGNQTTFYYSNMTAQNSTLNQGIWANLETRVRNTWMPACDTLYVVTGAMITTTTDKQVEYTLDRDGKEIAKPKYYYKALAQKRGDQYYTIAFKMNNEAIPTSSNFIPYRLSVSDLEKETGFTFFPVLSSDIKDKIETTVW